MLLFYRVSRVVASKDEESPSIAGQWWWVTPTEGDFKDSATETNRKALKAL